MKTTRPFLCLFIAIALFLALPCAGETNPPAPGPFSMPSYRPPLRGAPIGRIGGGTRGAISGMPVLQAVVPAHTGLTLRANPVLYWHLSEDSIYTMEISVIDDDAIEPVFHQILQPPVKKGIHSTALAGEGVSLSPGKPYRWLVAIVPDPAHRSRDILTGGVIERISAPQELARTLNAAQENQKADILSEAGIWYDAFHAVSMEAENPDTAEQGKARQRALLRQAGLPNLE